MSLVVSESSYVCPCCLRSMINNLLMSVHLAVKEFGGTGRVHNWEVSSLIVQTVPKAVFLAGGLNPQNIESAIEMVRLSSAPGCKSRSLPYLRLSSLMVSYYAFSISHLDRVPDICT